MRRLLFLAAVAASAVARPESYKEKEDFKYSRSSSDDGTKSGFYGAQRGNMGGNYERAHNMDKLAQHQMGGLIRQVEGELGDGSKTRTGSVYSAANTGGIYGSGHYDLSNLEGRNFQEGATYDDSQSHSSLTSHNSGYTGQFSSASNAAGYGSSHVQSSKYHGYEAAGHSDQTMQASNLQASNNLVGSSGYDYDKRAAHNMGYQIKSGIRGQNAYGQSNSNSHSSSDYDSNAQSRYITTPVRIVVTPGTRVAIPVAQNYDAAVSSYGQNAINSDAEVLHGNDQQSIYKHANEPKHYESSYSYRKQWEKHDTKPVAVPLPVPTVYPFPKNSELYEDTQGSSDRQFETNGIDSHSSNAYNRYNANVNSASSSQSQQRSNYNAQHQISSDSNAYTHGAYNSGAAASLTNQIENSDTRPKSYQSSYSYHKSWERQGDPYVIKPATNGLYDGQSSQKLTADLNHQGEYTAQQHGSHYHQSQHGSHYHQSHQRYASSSDDCDENGHIRVARSYRVAQDQEFTPYQQGQNIYEGQEDLGQQTQNGWQNYEDLGQQSQSKWDNIEDLGQQPQNKWDNLEDLGQQTQNLEDGGQQTQNQWDNLEDLGQQAQNQFDQQDVGQETQNTWDKLELSQQSQTNLGKQPQDTWKTLETEPKEHISRQTSEIRDSTDNLRKQTEDQRRDKEIQTQETPQGVSSLYIFSQYEHPPETVSGQNEHTRTQEVHTNWNTANQEEEELGQQTQDFWNNNENFHQNTYDINKPIWQLNEENTQQVPLNTDTGMNTNQNTFFDYNNRGYSKPTVYDQTQHHHNIDFNRQTQTHRTHSWTGFQTQNNWQEHSSNNNNNFFESHSYSSSSSPLSSLWNKIDSIEKQFSENNDNSPKLNSQESNHNFEHMHTDSDTDNNSTQINHFVSNTGNVQRPSNTFTTGTTEKPKDLPILHKQDVFRPQDIGRGDIGPEDSYVISMTGKPSSLFNDKINSSDDNNNTHKTPTEIESLITNNETNINRNLYNKSQNTNEYSTNQTNYLKQNNNEKETALNSESSILNLNQQTLVENQKPRELSSSSTVKTIQIDDSMNINQDFHIVNEQKQNKEIERIDNKIDLNRKQNLSKEDTEIKTSNFTLHDIQNNVSLDQNPIEIEPQIMDQQFESFKDSNENFHQLNTQRDIDILRQENESLNQQYENFGQQSETFGQESDDFGQQSESIGKQSEGFRQPSDQLENQFDFGQQNENLDQQSQTAWSDNLEDPNQQTQTVAKPNKNLQLESDTDLQHSHHQLEILEQRQNLDQQSITTWNEKLEDPNQLVQPISKPNSNLQQTDRQQAEIIRPQPDIHYKELHSSNLNKQHNNLESDQSITQKNTTVESPPEAATGKPGFWKSVGTKFVSAKEKVFSWFGSS